MVVSVLVCVSSKYCSHFIFQRGILSELPSAWPAFFKSCRRWVDKMAPCCLRYEWPDHQTLTCGCHFKAWLQSWIPGTVIRPGFCLVYGIIRKFTYVMDETDKMANQCCYKSDADVVCHYFDMPFGIVVCYREWDLSCVWPLYSPLYSLLRRMCLTLRDLN